MSEVRLMRPRVDVEGSRGGKIIGHTKSGKPIYFQHGHPSHGSFTEGDHREAQELHMRKGNQASNTDFQRHHFAQAEKHEQSSEQAFGKSVAKEKKKKGE